MSTTRTKRSRSREAVGLALGRRWKWLAWVPTVLGVIALAALSGPSRGQTPAPTQPPSAAQIEEMRKQIDALNKKLDELSKASAPKKAAEPSKAAGPEALTPGPEWLGSLAWRSIGPANMGGRITALAVCESDPSTFWVATAGGGLLKTVNNGVSFEHQFDREATVSIGDVAVAPSDRNIVWVGTGESNPRNSVSYGDGVYRSTDGGKTWTNMGLKGAFQIGKVVIHPKDPNTVYVGALGRLYGPSQERGLYKTTDGGKSFKKLTKGLPTVKLGRIGLEYYRKDPKTVYAMVESEKIGTGPRPKSAAASQVFMGVVGEGPEAAGATLGQVTPGSPADQAGLKAGDKITAIDGKEIKLYSELVELLRAKKPGDKLKVKVLREGKTAEFEVTLAPRPRETGGRGGPGGMLGELQINADRPFGASLGGQIENAQERQGPDGWQTGGLYKSTDGGESWTRVNSLNPRPFYFSQVRVDPSDEKYQFVLGISLHRSDDAGKTFRGDGGRGVHADHHAMWIDPKDGRHIIVGCDGGVYATYDRGANWDHFNTTAIGQFYHVAIDARRAYRAFGGLQDNGSWGGPTLVRSGAGPVNQDWFSVGGGDGFHCLVDPTDAEIVYATSQYGVLSRRNLRTGQSASIRPVAEKGERHRFNWNTPMLLSSHNPKIYYTAGEKVFRSLNQGADLRAVSPEISRTKEGTATALAESPRDPDVLYAGTDDGALWVTRNGGKDWTDVTKNVGLDRPCFVATIEASRAEAGRAYVVFDGHRSDTDDPLVFVTEDFGKTWKSLRANLPRGSSRCLREDLVNPNLLYLGTEFGIWASLDRGVSWVRINNNLPTVAVHDVAIHPTAGEIVAATHGRSLWVLDVSALRQIDRDLLKEKAALLKPTSAVRWRTEPNRGGTNRQFVGQNPPRGAQLHVALTAKPEKGASLRIVDVEGKTVFTSTVSDKPGLHRITWPLTLPAPQRPNASGGGAGGGGSTGRGTGGGAGGGRGAAAAVAGFLGRRGFGPPAPAGDYRVVLTVDGKEYAQTLKVELDPDYPAPPEIGGEASGWSDEGDEAETEAEAEAPRRPGVPD